MAAQALWPHAPPFRSGGVDASVEDTETLLSQWFGRPVVLTSSGRAALLLALRDLGLNRYRDRVAMSSKTASCVLDAVVRAAFPVDPAFSPDIDVSASLLIHQYGFRQKGRPKGPVVEDICHAFFETAESGSRNWAGDYAVFSLPKFFSLSGMVGGLVLATEDLAQRIKELRDQEGRPSKGQLLADRHALPLATGHELEAIYTRKLLCPAPDPGALVGFPATLAELADYGGRRAQVSRRVVDAIADSAWPAGWREMCSQRLPFAIPLFDEANRLGMIAKEFANIGLPSGIYSIDIACNFCHSNWQGALLLPAHNQLSDSVITDLVDIVGRR